MRAEPPDDAAYLAALERLRDEVEHEPIGRLRRQTSEAYWAATRIRNQRKRKRRSDAK